MRAWVGRLATATLLPRRNSYCSDTDLVALAQAPYGTFRGPAESDVLSPPLVGKAEAL